MKKILVLTTVLFVAAGFSLADQAKTTAANADQAAAPAATPAPTPFESQWPVFTNLSLACPIQRQFGDNYYTGGGFGIAVGYRLSREFSLWADYDFKAFAASNSAIGNISNNWGTGLDLSTTALWCRYNVLTTGTLRPYLFAGPGFSSATLSSSLKANNITGFLGALQTVPVAEFGAGLEVGLNPYLDFVWQNKWDLYFMNNNFNTVIGTDNPAAAYSFEVGFEFL